VAEGHVLLTETLAERIAAHCLSDPRALEVRVLVEKLDPALRSATKLCAFLHSLPAASLE
jgi:dihydroneopterin aldolase